LEKIPIINNFIPQRGAKLFETALNFFYNTHMDVQKKIFSNQIDFQQDNFNNLHKTPQNISNYLLSSKSTPSTPTLTPSGQVILPPHTDHISSYQAQQLCGVPIGKRVVFNRETGTPQYQYAVRLPFIPKDLNEYNLNDYLRDLEIVRLTNKKVQEQEMPFVEGFGMNENLPQNSSPKNSHINSTSSPSPHLEPQLQVPSHAYLHHIYKRPLTNLDSILHDPYGTDGRGVHSDLFSTVQSLFSRPHYKSALEFELEVMSHSRQVWKHVIVGVHLFGCQMLTRLN